jgi:ATP-dependent DNA helicase RecQ
MKTREVLMRREQDKAPRSGGSSTRPPKATAADLPASASGLFERLRAWRGATAKEQGVPAYVVFNDATMREIAMKEPATLDELGQVSGIGENKLARYGQAVLDLLNNE